MILQKLFPDSICEGKHLLHFAKDDQQISAIGADQYQTVGLLQVMNRSVQNQGQIRD